VTGLSTARHTIAVTNTTPPGIVNGQPAGGLKIMGFYADPGSVLLQTSVPVDMVQTVVSGAPLSFYVANTASVQLQYVATGAQISVTTNDKNGPYNLATPNTGVTVRSQIVWGLPAGIQKITVRVTSGALSLQRVRLLQAGGGLPSGSIVDGTSAPMLGVLGDSIGLGSYTLGFTRTADGFTDRVAGLVGMRSRNFSLGGGSATCFGEQAVGQVVAAHPARVIVALGVNDMIPGADFWGCNPTMDQFRAAMDDIISKLQAGLPGTPISLSAILPTTKVDDATRAQWNAVISGAATAHRVAYVDPSGQLSIATDYADGIHPNNWGHAKLAAFWAKTLTSPTA